MVAGCLCAVLCCAVLGDGSTVTSLGSQSPAPKPTHSMPPLCWESSLPVQEEAVIMALGKKDREDVGSTYKCDGTPADCLFACLLWSWGQ
jgi:hypothetical protein